jgi:hypothetical protein
MTRIECDYVNCLLDLERAMKDDPFREIDEHRATPNDGPSPNYLLGTLAWLLKQGMYAMILPGALIGLGCGWFIGIRSNAMGILCGVAGLALGIFCEWRFQPFIKDDSLAFFVQNLHQLRPGTQLMIAAGAIVAYWCGRGRG